MLCNIQDIQVHFAPRTQSVPQAAQALGLSPLEAKMYERFYGLKRLPYDDQGFLLDLARPVVDRLLDGHPELKTRLTHVVHCHTIPAIAPFDNAPLTQYIKTQCHPRVEFCSYTMSHCSTALSALQFTASLLNDDEYAILLIAEKAFHKWVRLVPDTTIMGEAACAVLLSKTGQCFQVLDNRSQRAGQFALNNGFETNVANQKAFQDAYPRFLAQHVEWSLHHMQRIASDIRYLLPHNVNKPSWLQVAKNINFPSTQIFLNNIEKYGHCFGSDPFINLHSLWQENKLSPGHELLLVSVGLGATASSALIRCGDLIH
ncbi:hypothetical protein VXI05_001944 [Vibrio parahaemolyticus]|nr:hypothetical protein [Vibrio parahaemolyticus]